MFPTIKTLNQSKRVKAARKARRVASAPAGKVEHTFKLKNDTMKVETLEPHVTPRKNGVICRGGSKTPYSFTTTVDKTDLVLGADRNRKFCKEEAKPLADAVVPELTPVRKSLVGDKYFSKQVYYAIVKMRPNEKDILVKAMKLASNPEFCKEFKRLNKIVLGE